MVPCYEIQLNSQRERPDGNLKKTNKKSPQKTPTVVFSAGIANSMLVCKLCLIIIRFNDAK